MGRRSFLGLGAVLTGSLALGGKPATANPAQESPPADAPWSQSIGAGVVDRPYGRPADTEASVIRRNVPWLTAGTESSVSFSPLQELQGIITPNGLFFERHHAGWPSIDPAQHKLMIHGLVERETTLSWGELLFLPMFEQYVTIACVSNEVGGNLVGNALWRGVRLKELLERSRPR